MTRLGIGLILSLAFLSSAVSAAEQAPLDERVDQAVEQGIDMVWSMLKPNGMFSGHDPHKRTEDYFYYGDWEVVSMTSLAYGGVKPEDPRIQTALKTLLELELDRTYTIGFRMIALAEFYRNAQEDSRPGLRAALRQDVDRMLAMHHDDGSWHYYGRNASQWDFSNTQIALLALSEAAACGVEIDAAVYQKTLKLYLEKQHEDGGWNYGNPTKPAGVGPSYAAMTAAGTANTFLLRDLLYPGEGCPCRNSRSSGRSDAKIDQAIDRGLAWLADKLPALNKPLGKDEDCNYYMLYACERVGIYSGFKYIGPHNWYVEGAEQILRHLPYRGRGGDDRGDAMFALLFLIKGRGPILMNKLRYDGEWDLHRRDAANLAQYVGRIKEQRVHWQVIHLDIPVDEMHDSPILYITAEKAFPLSDEHKKKLREFTDTGGTILLEASCANRAAGSWWPKVCQEIWPEWELKKLDRDHPLWEADLKVARHVPNLQGISDGLRTFLVYSPVDVSCKWHMMATTTDEDVFRFGNNLYAYATDRGKLRARLAAREVGAGKKYSGAKLSLKGDRKQLTVARLAHGGRWNLNHRYHPWALLAADLRERTGLELAEAEPVPVGGDVPAGVGLLYLGGGEALTMDDAARGRLKAYLDGGGFLLAEATAGNREFDASVREMLAAMGYAVTPAAEGDSLLSGAMPDGSAGYAVGEVDVTFALRPAWIARKTPLVFRIQSGDNVVGLYSPYDILFSQTGCKAFGLRGYAPADARALATNVVLLAAGRR